MATRPRTCTAWKESSDGGVLAHDDRRGPRSSARFYQDQGYAYANVLPLTKVDLPTRKISLTFEVARGKRAYFERINIRGNTKTRDKVIRRG